MTRNTMTVIQGMAARVYQAGGSRVTSHFDFHRHDTYTVSLKFNSTSNLVFSIVLIAVCVTGLLFGGKRLVAEYHFEQAKARVEEWVRLDAVYRLDEWNAAAGHIDEAVMLNPRRAEFHFYKALVYEWGLQAPFPNDPELSPGEQTSRITARVDSFRRITMQAYRDALSQRPASAQSWIGLTDTKGQLGEFDDEFIHAYTMANVHAENLQYYQNSLAFLAARYFEPIQSLDKARSVQMAYLGSRIAGDDGMRALRYLEDFRQLVAACAVFLEENLPMVATVRSRCESAVR